MRIIHIDTNTDFDMPPGFITNLSLYNALLTDIGEQTNPITLPATPKNLRLTGWSNRIDASYKPVSDISVLVLDGILVRRANLGIHTIDTDDGISCTIYLNTGEFYSILGDTKLASLNWPTYENPIPGTTQQNVEYLIDLLKTYSVDNIFVICPVLTSQEIKLRVTKYPWLPSPTIEDVESLLILNWFEQYQYALNLDSLTDNYNMLQGDYTQTLIESDGTVVTIGKGYGITPFIKLTVALNKVFETYGYTFNMADITSVVSGFSQLFILNNVADAIYSGVLRFAQLLPDITIKNFIAEIEKLLCGKFIFSSNSKTVKFRFFQTAIGSAPYNFTSYIAGRIKMEPYQFVNKAININNSIATTNDQSVEAIDFNLKTRNLVDAEFRWERPLDNAKGYQTYRFEMVSVDGVLHKNSDMDNNENTKKDDNISTSFDLATFTNQTQSTIPSSLPYKTSKPIFGSIENATNQLADLYAELIEFNQSANLPFTLPVKIPHTILQNYDLTLPVLLENQKVFIEKIEAEIGENSDQQILTVRTTNSLLSR